MLPQEHGNFFRYLMVYATDGTRRLFASFLLCLFGTTTAFVLPVFAYRQLVVASRDRLPRLCGQDMRSCLRGLFTRAGIGRQTHS